MEDPDLKNSKAEDDLTDRNSRDDGPSRSFGVLRDSRELRIEHLRNQYQHLLVLREFHLHAEGRTSSAEISKRYRAVAEALSNVLLQYDELLKGL